MLGALISAGASLASSFLGNKSAEKAREKESAQQREFAQNGIQWKVQDAKNAGVHPLYALGANTVSYSPQSVGGSDFSGLASAGQDIGRAVDATRSTNARTDVLATRLANAQITGAELDNDIKRATLASQLATQSAGNPGLPGSSSSAAWGLDGQGNAPQVDAREIKRQGTRDPNDPKNPAYVYGASPSVDLMRNPSGGYSPVIPKQLAESTESDPYAVVEWMIRNRLLSPMGYGDKPSIPGRLPWQTRQYRNYEWVNADVPRNRTFGRFNTRKDR